MAKRDGAEVRKERIAEIGRFVVKALQKSGELPLPKTVALLMYNYGLTKETVMEYLNLLADVGMFNIDEKQGKIKKRAESEEN